MIGSTYILTASTALFIYTSRLYTNRTVLAGIGKAYIPVEEGELGKNVRKMIVKQLERSAIVAWESRPRDLYGEILRAESAGVLPPETASVGRNDYTVGKEISVDPAYPPWGDVRHPGWSSPSHTDENVTPNLQYATVVAELPNLIEAKAVSLAPVDHMMFPPRADPIVADVLRRAATMGMRDYLTQLSYLGLVNPLHIGRSFLLQYEKARFGGLPITDQDFTGMMATFAELLEGMTDLKPEIIEQIREQAGDQDSSLDTEDIDARMLVSDVPPRSPESPESSAHSPVTARTAFSRSVTPYLSQGVESEETIGSVVRRTPDHPAPTARSHEGDDRASDSGSLADMSSDAGSVLRHRTVDDDG